MQLCVISVVSGRIDNKIHTFISRGGCTTPAVFLPSILAHVCVQECHIASSLHLRKGGGGGGGMVPVVVVVGLCHLWQVLARVCERGWVAGGWLVGLGGSLCHWHARGGVGVSGCKLVKILHPQQKLSYQLRRFSR
jgi:hypothetical protein